MKNRITTVFFVALCLAMVPQALMSQESKRVLFIGNSYTDVNNLPQTVASVAASMGDVVDYASNTPGGCTFAQHCTNNSMQMIRQGGWDVVVLQEQSQYPSFPQQQVESEVFPYAARLVDSVYAASPCAEPMFYMTWGRKNGDTYNAQYFPILGTYEGMDSMLYVRYVQMAADNDASLCPVGRVWRYLRNNEPAIELYQSDDSHPSLSGTYAAACAFYVMLFHKDPTLVTFDGGIGEGDAERIRNAVRIVVYDSLDRWLRAEPEVSFAVGGQEDGVVTFVASPRDADSLVWNFGDGVVEHRSATEMTVNHRYAATGDYNVCLVATRHCMADTQWLALTVTTVGDTTADDTVGFSAVGVCPVVAVAPNPVVDELTVTIAGLHGEATVAVLDCMGRTRKVCVATTERCTVPVADLPSGVYIVRVDTPAGTVQSKMLKR